MLPRVDLSHLDKPFDGNKIAYAISQLPSDRASGPNSHRPFLQKVLAHHQRQCNGGGQLIP
jgi:hypothetical protein